MSEQEILLLSNYVYMSDSVSDLSIQETLNKYRNAKGGFDAESVGAVRSGGGLTHEQVADLFREMDQMSPEFKSLRPVKTLDEPEIRGVLFESAGGSLDGGSGDGATGGLGSGLNGGTPGFAGKEGTVIFRGTGGSYEAWNDNVIGEYLTETKIQKKAADFVSGSCKGYNHLTVGGHSKGGNLAMYTAVVCPEVTTCVSYDGQGFSEDFRRSYANEIANASGKIKSISAHNDFVNILLTSIAGEVVYAQNSEDGMNAHSSYYLYQSNRFDRDGNLISTREQSIGAKMLKQATDGVVEMMDRLPGEGRIVIANLLGAYTAAAMSNEQSEWYEQRQIARETLSVCDYIFGRGLLKRTFSLSPISVYRHERNGSSLSGAAGRCRELSCEMKKIYYGIRSLSTESSYGPVDGYVNLTMDRIIRHLEECLRGMETVSGTLEEVAGLYSKKEAAISEDIQSGHIIG